MNLPRHPIYLDDSYFYANLSDHFVEMSMPELLRGDPTLVALCGNMDSLLVEGVETSMIVYLKLIMIIIFLFQHVIMSFKRIYPNWN